jgi:hypothetical protein
MNEKLSISWHSPYQTKAYFEACQFAGVECEQITEGKNQYFFYKQGDQYIAWELCEDPIISTPIPNGYGYFKLNDKQLYEDIEWVNGSYSTLISTMDTFRVTNDGIPKSFSPRFIRSLKKSFNAGLQHSLAETDQQVLEALQLFQNYPDRIDGQSFDHFHSFVKSLLMMDAAEINVVYMELEETDVVGSAVVLKAPSQVNMRYYSALRIPSNPGHFLHHSVIAHYINKPEIQVVDQSGVSSPNETDPKLKDISEFKLQTSQDTVQFIYSSED